MPLCWMKGNLPPPFLPPQAKEKSGGGNEYKGFVKSFLILSIPCSTKTQAILTGYIESIRKWMI